jgi:hypothetical protein
MVNRFLLITIVAATGLSARANYLFTWNGSSNLFQGSFEVTDAEYQPGQFYLPLSLTNSISITSPDGHTFNWMNVSPNQDTFYVASSSPAFLFYIGLFSGPPTAQGSFSVEADENSIQEWALPPGNDYILYSETGSWNVTYVPEPSVIGLLAVGAAACWIGRRRLVRGI